MNNSLRFSEVFIYMKGEPQAQRVISKNFLVDSWMTKAESRFLFCIADSNHHLDHWYGGIFLIYHLQGANIVSKEAWFIYKVSVHT